MSDDNKRNELIEKVKGFFKTDGESSEGNKELLEKKKILLKFFNEKKQWLIHLGLLVIIWIGAFIRTRNLNLLKDVTTGNYIPLALDPHSFTRYARFIIENGYLMMNDPMRFVPLGTDTLKTAFVSFFIAYLYKFMSLFSSNVTVEYASVIYPVVAFVVAMVFFFLLLKRLFDWKIAMLATIFLSILPAFLHRTMAGFSDHEALGVMFMFMALYVYVVGWKSKSYKTRVATGLGAGLLTGLMGLGWGGWKFLVLMISLFMLVEFFFNRLNKFDYYQYSLWVVGFVLATTTFIPRFTLKTLIGSATTGIAFLVLGIFAINYLLFDLNLIKIKDKFKGKFPKNVFSLLVTFILGVAFIVTFLGPGELMNQIDEVNDNLLHPLGNDRWELTVAEQNQPYFRDWFSQFGPMIFGFPAFLTILIIGSILLFFDLVKRHKNKFVMSLVYVGFILSFMMSRYSAGSTFNGVNFISKAFYLGSLVIFAGLGAYLYFNAFYKNHEELKLIGAWKKEFIFVLVWFIIMVIAARGASRLFFIFAPIAAVMASYAVIKLFEQFLLIKNKGYKYLAILILLLIVVSPFAFPFKGIIPQFYESTLGQATYSGPAYNPQWQATGKWVRENVQEDAVFGHWWDYGYWVQNGFERATVLDGQNKVKYWNHLMGRHVLTGQTQEEALEFLKVHETTHYLIVADEIGKYTAYSSIGANEDNDRFSWISTFSLNPQGTKETKNATVYFYQGGYSLDDDFVWEGKIYPAREAGVGAVYVPLIQSGSDEDGINVQFQQPSMILVHRGQQVQVPLTCLFVQDQFVRFDGEGYDGCFRLIPAIGGNGQIENPLGHGLFISEEGRKALWVNLYLFNQKNPEFDTSAFKFVYGEDGTFAPLSIYNGRMIGPHKIWEINYPDDLVISEELEKRYLGGNEYLPDYFFDVN
jgi:asparagine N-glycosylation enzyme membrane subunit Stt3